MRDVGSQLAEYFEAATERIDAEDVLARAAVNHQLEELPHYGRLRPAWAAAFGFIGVLALVGGALLAGWMLRDPTVVEPQPIGAPVTATGDGWGWWPLLAVGAVALVGFVALVAKRLRRATKEVDMQTTETRVPERTETQRRPGRLRWMVGLTVLAVALIGGGIWAIVEANQTSDIEIATDLVDDWIAGWNAGDSEAVLAVFTDEVQEQELVTAERFMPNITNVVRTSSLVTTELDKTYRYTLQFDWASYAYAAEYEVELDGELLSRMEATRSFDPIDEVQLYSEDPES